MVFEVLIAAGCEKFCLLACISLLDVDFITFINRR